MRAIWANLHQEKAFSSMLRSMSPPKTVWTWPASVVFTYDAGLLSPLAPFASSAA